jgi:hypothetical protein
MTDVRLRDAERRALSGSVEDQARALTERLRAGTLTRERLGLAAYVGHEPARVALTGDARNGWAPYRISTVFGRERGYDSDTYQWHVLDAQPFGEWLRDLRARVNEVDSSDGAARGGITGWALFRAAVAAARLALPSWEAGPTAVSYDENLEPVGLHPRRCVEAAETLRDHPGPELLDALRSTVDHARRGNLVLVPSWALLDCCFTGKRGKVTWLGCEAVIFFAMAQAGDHETRTAIARDLASWALGGQP